MTEGKMTDRASKSRLPCTVRKDAQRQSSANVHDHCFSEFLSLCFSVWRFQMLLEGLSFVKTLATFGIHYVTDQLRGAL